MLWYRTYDRAIVSDVSGGMWDETILTFEVTIPEYIYEAAEKPKTSFRIARLREGIWMGTSEYEAPLGIRY